MTCRRQLKRSIHSFEPNPELCARLERRFARNSRVVFHNVGLSDAEGEAFLYMPVYRGYSFHGLAGLDETDVRRMVAGMVARFDPRLLSVRPMTIRLARLDDLDLAPTFVKLDIQGHEYRALLGAEQTIRGHKPVLLIEKPEAMTTAWLTDLGYQPYAFDGHRFVAGHGRPNTFFLSRDSI